jgi:hypothetical protein
LFLEVDQPALRSLPAERFDLSVWSQATVNIDYHIQFEGSFYSVPYQLARQMVEVRATRAIKANIVLAKVLQVLPFIPLESHGWSRPIQNMGFTPNVNTLVRTSSCVSDTSASWPPDDALSSSRLCFQLLGAEQQAPHQEHTCSTEDPPTFTAALTAVDERACQELSRLLL